MRKKEEKSMCIFCKKRLTSRMSNFMTDPEENETFYARNIQTNKETNKHLRYMENFYLLTHKMPFLIYDLRNW